jgi:hypothetical protein
MTDFQPQIAADSAQLPTSLPKKTAPSSEVKDERILCPHCQRTASNGIKCKGICVAESDY